jgi:hypothetical protein
MDFYPKNTLQNYKTRVCITEEFAGKWEVGLVNITYPRMWYNVNKEDAVCYVQFMNWDTKTATIPIGRYTSMEQLIEALNKALNSTLPATSHQIFQLSYDRLTRKVTYDMINNPNRTTIKLVLPESPGNEVSSDDIINTMSTSVVGSSFSPAVASILGFEDTKDRKTWSAEFHMQNVGAFTGKHVADLNRGIHSLYVYCDIMEPCPVGDTRVPLLRIVPLKETSDNSTSTMQCTQTFSHVHYHILRHRYITEVEIDIKDSMGRPVPFERGELMVTLHLRRAEF